jgi:TRAP-type C4-dicarboxylate transport system permease small subunit
VADTQSVNERTCACDTAGAGPGVPSLGEFLEKLASWFNWVAIVALLLMFGVMVADILSAKILNLPITATVDVVSLLAVLVASFSVSKTILAGRHIEVEFVVCRLPKGLRRGFNTASSCLVFLFLLLIIWRSFAYGVHLFRAGESSLTAHIPNAPFVIAMAVACIPAVLIYAARVYRDAKEAR